MLSSVNKFCLFVCFLFLLACSKKAPEAAEIVEEITPENPTPTPPSSEPVGDTPNILFIIADDMGLDATPRYGVGNNLPAMPTLTSWMDNGIRFTNVWTNPVCSPTRAAILTGKYGYRTGVLNPEEAGNLGTDETILHRLLNESSSNPYATSIIGKWHLSGRNTADRPIEMGAGYYAGILTGGVDSYSSWSFTQNGATTTSNAYVTTKLTDLAIDWIGNQEQPWLCWLAYTAPHSPIHLPPQDLHTRGALPDDQASINENPLPYYLAMIESLDTEMGRLVSTLSSSTLENTLIVFLGDNGSPRNVIQAPYSNTQGKGSLYQGGIHVPMVMSGYGVERIGETEDALITSVDLFSTFLTITGNTQHERHDSQNFLPLLTSSGGTIRNFSYTEYLADRPNQSGYTLRNSSYKLIVFDNGNQALYNLENDPYESTNLMNANLSSSAQAEYNSLTAEAARIRQ